MFKGLVKGFGVRFPISCRGLSDMIGREVTPVQSKRLPEQGATIPASLTLDGLEDASRRRHYCVPVHTGLGTEGPGQGIAWRMRDADWVTGILPQIVDELAKCNYCIVRMMENDTRMVGII